MEPASLPEEVRDRGRGFLGCVIGVSLPRLSVFSGMGGKGCVLTRSVVGTLFVMWMEVASELSVLQTSDPSAGPAKPSGALMLELLLEAIIGPVVGLSADNLC